MAGRTLGKWLRPYVNGYDMSGYANQIGEMGTDFEEVPAFNFSDALQGFLPGQGKASPLAINGVFDPTASVSWHANFATADLIRNVIVAIGMRAEPAQGDPAWCIQAHQLTYKVNGGGGNDPVTLSAKFSGWDVSGSTLLYAPPLGVILRPKTATTGVNAGSGVDDYGAATAFGGLFAYQVTAGNGTATLSVDDSADNSSFLALSGATSGSIDCSTPKSGVVALGLTATVRRYLRWQIALGTATTVTAVWAFVRAFHN